MPKFWVLEVMHADLSPLSFELMLLPAVPEVADQFLLLGVDIERRAHSAEGARAAFRRCHVRDVGVGVGVGGGKHAGGGAADQPADE